VRSTGEVTTCECNHLTDFSTTTSTYDSVMATLMNYKNVDMEYLRKNWGVVTVVCVLYGGFLLGLTFLRFRRTRESLYYLRWAAIIIVIIVISIMVIAIRSQKLDSHISTTGNDLREVGVISQSQVRRCMREDT
jgi:uncharacterized membrane protein